MEKGNRYTWNQIVTFGINGDYARHEYGVYINGCEFIVLRSELHTLSFVLTDLSGQESIYECIFAE